MSYGINWLLIAEVLKAAVPPLIAIVVAYIAWHQWQTAKDKLALDLFDRRHAVWIDASAAYTQALRDLHSIDTEKVGPLWVSPGLASFGHAKERAYFLFGSDVIKPWVIVEQALFHLGHRKGRGRDFMETDVIFDARQQAEDRYSRDAQVGWEDLRKAIEPYMMMGHIAVNRPGKPRT